MEKLFDIILGLLTLVLVIVVFVGGSMILHGFVLSQMWNWFIAPLFDLRQLNLLQGIGMSLFVTVFRSVNQNVTKDRKAQLVELFLQPILLLTIGYIVHLFI